MHTRLHDRLWIAPSCSLLHVPVDLTSEEKLDSVIQSWLAFAVQKLDELSLLARALNEGRHSVFVELLNNAASLDSRKQSSTVHNQTVKQRVIEINNYSDTRQLPYQQRAVIQQNKLNLPLYPTTTIGSFPQTTEIRKARKEFRYGELSTENYNKIIQKEIERCVRVQEVLAYLSILLTTNSFYSVG